MGNEEVEVNGKTFKKEYLDNVLEMYKSCEVNLYRVRLTFLDFSQFYGLEKEEYDNLIQHLNEMDDILHEYYENLAKAKGNNNG